MTNDAVEQLRRLSKYGKYYDNEVEAWENSGNDLDNQYIYLDDLYEDLSNNLQYAAENNIIDTDIFYKELVNEINDIELLYYIVEKYRGEEYDVMKQLYLYARITDSRPAKRQKI